MPDYHCCHIDDNLATLSNLVLLRLEEDEDLRAMYLMGLDHFWHYERIERNPLFNMVYGIFTGSPCDIDSAVYNLKDMNLDLLCYSIDATGRDDIEIDCDPEMLGEPCHLKVPLDYSESVKHNFDQQVFKIKSDSGYGIEYPTVYLLPYWIGRYYKIIKESEKDLK
ncbi:hypothetical protein SDC9_195810 [bioreactor metagenome]|uniref:Uncharacterized protein n=1 Tax=bioreactor metagenome TaxID=1076179 RepID=A0A645IA32_9ZZZZ